MIQTNIPLGEMTLRQLRRVASVLGVSRYSRMRKDQLLSSIVDKQGDVDHQTLNQTLMEAVIAEPGPDVDNSLADVDAALPDLPSGYGESRIFLMPRDSQWAYAYWDIPNEHRNELRAQGGQQLALRLYDVTDINISYQSPHNLQEHPCDELAREWYMPVPVSDRDYMLEIGYRTWDGRWLVLAQSAAMRIPPVYPSDWVEDHFLTVDWQDDLRGKTVMTLVPPTRKLDQTGSHAGTGIHESVFGMAADAEALRMAGSLFGSMQPVESLSSYLFPSGVGMWAMPNMSGLNMSGVGMFSASAAPVRPRNFWLIADAELIVYGATEPDATVYVDGQPIALSADGTFRFQMSFQDGQLKFPIVAVAADGEQNRSIRMDFERETSDRRTNTKAEAVTEWFPA